MGTPAEPLESVYPRVFLSTVGSWGCTFRAISQDGVTEYRGVLVFDVDEDGRAELWGFSSDPDWRGLRGGVQTERWSKYLKVAAHLWKAQRAAAHVDNGPTFPSS